MKFSKFLRNKKTDEKTFYIFTKAHHDWKIMLIVFVFISAIVIFADGYILYKVQNGTLFDAPSVSSDQKIILQKRSVERVIEKFDEKKAELEKFQNISPAEIDPSL